MPPIGKFHDSEQDTPQPLRVLIIAPYFDKTVAGESWCTYKWVEGICKRTEATILSTHTPNWNESESPTTAKELVNWTHTKFQGKLTRLDNELKPHYIKFYWHARKWIKQRIKSGWDFDLIHQINPVALRYPSPAAGLGIPYILGPHAGSIETPQGFRYECQDKQWYRKMRSFDSWRIKLDPWIRKSFSDARVVLGVAPYVREFLSPIKLKRFEIMAETGPDEILEHPKKKTDNTKPLRLLFVGRVIRTKGVIDAIRAVSIAKEHSNITFDIVGIGDMIDECKAEARNLKIDNIVTFHGRIPRSEVFEWYKRSDVFLFPSFREPSGTVVFEALGFGLPLITCAGGGPGYVVDKTCGRLVDATTPTQFAKDLAASIIDLHSNRNELEKLSSGALKRVQQVASWDLRLNRLLKLYSECL